MLSGVVYTLVGIKNKFLHICLSAAYLASVAVTVLILYIMNPPISNAIQGAYVVAVVVTGLILGGGAIVFTEMTEGLGCLLGGFCFSMWLLVLKPGGLITSTGGKCIFIAAFTFTSFATSFSHYTRPYGLIVLISFAGATAVVLGIDCFSRAGLKEFWAYIWDLNDNLFPLGATTYPVTRGIRVEVAAIMVIFLAGIISQMKLWKVIKERREQRATERLQNEQTMEQEEQNVGRRIESHNAEDRNQWEAVYGDKDASKNTRLSNRDSGVGDMDSQNKGPISTLTSLRRSGEDEIEMSEMQSPTVTTGAGLVMSNKRQNGGPITVKVARDVEPLPELGENGISIEPSQNRLSHASARSSLTQKPAEEKIWVVSTDGEARLERRPSQRNSKRISNPMGSGIPEVVHLPFKVPEGEIEDDRSSVATFADDEQDGQKRQSKHLSPGTAFLRRLSKRSERSSKRFSIAEGQSTEDLVIPGVVENDRRSSVAATMDGLSDEEDMRSARSSIWLAYDDRENQALGNVPTVSVEDSQKLEIAEDSQPNPTVKLIIQDPEERAKRPISDTTVATHILESAPVKDQEVEKPTVEQSLTSSTDPKPKEQAHRIESAEVAENYSPAKPADAPPSVISAVESKPASITKDRLPPQLSRVVMSYRTNEWAKHLSNADAPEVEELKLADYPVDTRPKAIEVAAPVNVKELQQTAENAMPPATRTVSQMSNHALPAPTRSSSAQSKTYPPPHSSRLEIANGFQHPEGPPSRSMSQQSFNGQSSQQSLNNLGRGLRNSSTHIPQPIVESPIEEGSSSSPNLLGTSKLSASNLPFGTTNTLMGKRDTMVRNKTTYYTSSSVLPSTPEFPTSHFQSTTPISQPGSDAGSIYNYPNHSTPAIMDDDNMSLSARRELIRNSSLQQLPMAPVRQTPVPFDSHQPRRQPSAPSPLAREQQLASWRASVQHELQSEVMPRGTIERQRSMLWQERQAEEQRKAMDAWKKSERDSAFDQRMRRGDMLDAHREALRKMQAAANKHA
jgi:hypothetical protein